MQVERYIPKDLFPCSSEYLYNQNPYYIVAPDYTHKSAGIRLLHQLCSVLNQMGHEAYMVTNKINGALWTPRLTDETKVAHYLTGKKPIVVYPEVIKGQPLGFGLPVRYVLNYPGLLGGGDRNYQDNETIFTFHAEYYESPNLLYLPLINIKQIESVKPLKERVSGSSALYYNRYTPSKSEIEDLGDGCIDVSTKSDHEFEDIIAILKSVEILYCFETSAIMNEAIFCGCAIVLLPNKQMKQLPEIIKNRGLKGISWGKETEDIRRAIDTVNEAKEKFLNDLINWIPQLQRFIDLTQSKSNKLESNSAWPQEVVDELPIPGQSSSDISARLDRKKYSRVNHQFKDWVIKSSLREIDADIYAQYISKGDLPQVAVVVHHITSQSSNLIADTLDSIGENFFKVNSVTVVSDVNPPDGFVQTTQMSWISKDNIKKHWTLKDDVEWVLTLEAGVRLAPNALVELAIAAKSYIHGFLIYADEDILNPEGVQVFPNFKPAFNKELIRCTNYVGSSVLFKKNIWCEAHFPITAHEIYKYLISSTLNNHASNIYHVAGVLFHGTGHVNAATENLEFEVARNTLMSHDHAKAVKPLDRLGTWLVEYEKTQTRNTTLVVPTGVQPGYMRQMLESLQKYTCPNLAKILLVCKASDWEEVDFALRDIAMDTPIEIITYQDSEYNHSRALNLAIEKVDSEYVWVCDDDMEFIHPDTLGVLLSFAQQDDVGCVEPRLMSTQGTEARLASGPMVLGVQGACAAYTGEMQLPEESGYFSRLQLTQDVSTVSGHCFAFKKSLWQLLVGFDEQEFSLRFSVLDFCIRLNQQGYRHVWAPLANALHQGGRSLQKRLGDFEFKVAFAQKEVAEKTKLLERWGQQLANDRFYNRNLSLVKPYDVESNIVIDWVPNRKDRLRVLASPLTSGAGQYRVVEPLEMLQDQSLVQSSVILPMVNKQTRVLQPVELIRANPDTLILQHSVDDVQLSLIEQYKIALPKVNVVQMVDDLMGYVPEKHPSRRFQSREGHLRMSEAIKKSDSMIVTTEPLKLHYEKYLSNVKIIPNCLAKHWFELEVKKTKREKLRVGWIGAGQHQGDLEIINEVVKALADKVDWVFMGMHTAEVGVHIKEFHPFVSISEYPNKMASLDLDIAVAPLEDNFFNSCKSNLRLLEYGAMSWPVVCSDVFPYQTNNPPVIRVKDSVADWLDALNKLIDDESERSRLGQALNKWVVNNYTLSNWAPEWFDALMVGPV